MTILVDDVFKTTVLQVLLICMCSANVAGDMISQLQFLELNRNGSDLEWVLDYMTEVNTKYHCDEIGNFRVLPVPIRTQRFDLVRQKADLVSRFVEDYGTGEAKHFIPTLLKNIVQSDVQVYGSEMVLFLVNKSHPSTQHRYSAAAYRSHAENSSTSQIVVKEEMTLFVDKKHAPERPREPSDVMNSSYSNSSLLGNWMYPYYSCKYKRLIMTYSVPLEDKKFSPNKSGGSGRSLGTFDIDIDVSYLDINQCEIEFSSAEDAVVEIPLSQIVSFRGTHKCDRNTSKCIFTAGGGWSRGSYACRCKDGFYSTARNPVFNGTSVENAWKEQITYNSATYSLVYVCKQCAPGCDSCTDGNPCLAEYNWPFRISLLTISVLCMLLTLLLMCYVYNYKRLKVIKVSSPIFLCITLVGAVIMYLEMAAIFPVLDLYACIATKWTRHLGFCITYSALLLKTWRVSLTYRVKSAHKIKLTDKQLLQWLFPILLVMVIYLSTWTVSSPPHSVFITDYNGLKLKQCTYDWWDHSLAIGEIVFLLWGIRVCYTVRNAESFFNESKHISYAIYNIAVVNAIMVAIHLLIFPTAPPDIKYLFGFIRTQLSTTVTILLVFGPKFYRVIKGQGDIYDNRARARGVTASFSLNGIGLVREEPTDLYQENEELKEEIQKLAAQIEFMKIVHMEMNNRHIKPKAGGYFSQCAVNSTQNPLGKAIYMKFDSSDSPTSRISPAAELISERV